jgi:predicted enzyme related to lactoylglutathione lyase
MRLAYGIFYTNNISRISEFYQNIIGFNKVFGDERFIAFSVGDALLGIKAVEMPREIPGHQSIIIEVENVDELYESLKQKEVTFDKEISDEEWGRNFSILDPDLNKVEFFKSR